MLLYLLRHGVAVDREDPDCPADALRPLTGKGVEKVRLAVAGLRRLGVKPGVIVSSPLLRAVQTAEIAAEILGHAKDKIKRTPALEPSADPADLLREVARWKAEEVLCAGHAPQLDELIAHAVGARTAFTALKKSGAACLEFASTGGGRGVLLWVFPPKVLRFLGE
jgi:phosphohistidine phosphatase